MLSPGTPFSSRRNSDARRSHEPRQSLMALETYCFSAQRYPMQLNLFLEENLYHRGRTRTNAAAEDAVVSRSRCPDFDGNLDDNRIALVLPRHNARGFGGLMVHTCGDKCARRTLQNAGEDPLFDPTSLALFAESQVMRQTRPCTLASYCGPYLLSCLHAPTGG